MHWVGYSGSGQNSRHGNLEPGNLNCLAFFDPADLVVELWPFVRSRLRLSDLFIVKMRCQDYGRINTNSVLCGVSLDGLVQQRLPRRTPPFYTPIFFPSSFTASCRASQPPHTVPPNILRAQATRSWVMPNAAKPMATQSPSPCFALGHRACTCAGRVMGAACR